MSEKEDKKKKKEEKKKQKDNAKKLAAIKKKEAKDLKEAKKREKNRAAQQEHGNVAVRQLSTKINSKKKLKFCPIISRRKSRKSTRYSGVSKKSLLDDNKPAKPSRRPKDTAFFQQRLPAWEPLLNAGAVYMAFIIVGLVLMIIGAVCFFLSESVNEKVIDYTQCSSTKNSSSCSQVLKSDPEDTCSCKIDFKIETSIKGEVLMYYSLTNFYQNHRKYVKSRDDSQLLGKLNEDPSDDCKPFKTGASGKPIIPCGAIANSMFNDTIQLFQNKSEITLSTSGIAWEWDVKTRFANPTDVEEVKSKFDKPENWKKPYWELEGGLQNPDLINWMRTSALPTFRKLYRKISDGLSEGDYQLIIDYSFMIKSDSFKKRVIFSNLSILGGKNPALGIISGVVGLICALLGVICLYLHIKYGKRPYKGEI